MGENLRIGLFQMDIVWEDKEANYWKAERAFQLAAKKSIDLLLFPELCSVGFTMNVTKAGETSEKERTSAYFKELSLKYGLAAGFGYVGIGEFSDNGDNKENLAIQDKALNKYRIVDKSGIILCDYSKIHPFTFGNEGIYYQGGNQVVQCEIQGLTVAPFVCYDLRFPEIFQIASRTAHVITVAANWPIERREHFTTLLRARAIENQCYVAGVNRVGKGGGVTYGGDSMLIDPYGNILCQGSEQEELLIGTAEKEVVLNYRDSFPLKADRREELYRNMHII